MWETHEVRRETNQSWIAAPPSSLAVLTTRIHRTHATCCTRRSPIQLNARHTPHSPLPHTTGCMPHAPLTAPSPHFALPSTLVLANSPAKAQCEVKWPITGSNALIQARTAPWGSKDPTFVQTTERGHLPSNARTWTDVLAPTTQNPPTCSRACQDRHSEFGCDKVVGVPCHQLSQCDSSICCQLD